VQSFSVAYCQVLFNKNQLTDIDSFAVLPYGGFGSSWGMTFEDIDKDTIKLIGNGPSGNSFHKIFCYDIVNDSTFNLRNRIDGTLANIDYSVIQDGLKRLNDSVIVLATTYIHWDTTNYTMDTIKSGLLFFNNQGDTLYSRWFGESKRFLIRGFERIDNHLFLLGTTTIIGDGKKSYIVKTDLQGNLIWEKMLTQYTSGYCFIAGIEKSNGGYLVNGLFNEIFNVSGSAFGGIYKLSSSGNIEWFKAVYDTARGAQKIRKDSIDNTYYFLGSKDTIVNVGDYPINAFISKIDSLGNFIWIKVFNEHPKIFKNIWQYRILKNGDLIFCGERLESLGGNVHAGWICRTDKLGNILWENMYKLHEYGGVSSYNLLADIKEMPDGGFLATGTCKDTITKYQGIWLIRVDSNGCLIPGCFPTAVQVYPTEDFHINVYPNPSQGNFTVEYSKPTTEKLMLQVFDVSGRKIQVQHILKDSYKSLVSLQQPLGIYFLKLINEQGKPIFSQKIMIE
jgi:hypothetical protein